MAGLAPFGDDAPVRERASSLPALIEALSSPRCRPLELQPLGLDARELLCVLLERDVDRRLGVPAEPHKAAAKPCLPAWLPAAEDALGARAAAEASSGSYLACSCPPLEPPDRTTQARRAAAANCRRWRWAHCARAPPNLAAACCYAR